MPLIIIAWVIALVFFGIAAYQDWKYRIVQNKVWALFAPIATATTLARVQGNIALQTFALTFITTNIILCAGLFYMNTWGGADSKAFILLGLALPFEYLTVVIATAICSIPILIQHYKSKTKKEYPIVTILFSGLTLAFTVTLFCFGLT